MTRHEPLCQTDDPRFGVSPWYDQEGRTMTPTAIGYAGAAFYRYRARLGADVESRIELYPSSQWGLL
jgi:hypothetical protein